MVVADFALAFLAFCGGTSCLLVAGAGAVKLLRGERHLLADQRTHTMPAERLPDPIDDGLSARLRAFQEARFASPIVARRLDDDAGPIIKPPPLRSRPFSTPVQSVNPPRPPRSRAPLPKLPAGNDNDGNIVIPLPLKQRRTDPPKEG